MFRHRGGRVRHMTVCAVSHPCRAHRQRHRWCPAQMAAALRKCVRQRSSLPHDPFRSGIIQATRSLYPAGSQVVRVICTWLPPGTEPRPSWGEPPDRTPPARPTLSRRGVTRAGRFRIGRARPGQAALLQRHHPSRVTQDAPCRCRRPATKSCGRQADGTSAGQMMRRSARRAQSPPRG